MRTRAISDHPVVVLFLCLCLTAPAVFAQEAVSYSAGIRLFLDEGSVRIGTDRDLDGRLDDEFLFLTGEDLVGLAATLPRPYEGWADRIDYSGDALAVETRDGLVRLRLAVSGTARPDPQERSWNLRQLEGSRLTRYYGFEGVEFAGWVPPFLPLSANCGKPGLGDEDCDSTGTGGGCGVSGCGAGFSKKELWGTISGTTEGKPPSCSTRCSAGEICCAGCVAHAERNFLGIETHKTYYATCTCCK